MVSAGQGGGRRWAGAHLGWIAIIRDVRDIRDIEDIGDDKDNS